MTPLAIVFMCVSAVLAGFIVTRVLLKVDEKIEEAKRNLIKLATILTNYGLKRIPQFLIDLAVNDWKTAIHKIAADARLFTEGDDTEITKEFDQAFDNILKVKLGTEAGRAYIAAKLADAATSTDVSVVAVAPQPATK